MMLRTERLLLRGWEPRDLDTLVELADNRAVAINLRDHFPNPYTRADGEAWLALQETVGDQHFAIEYHGGPVGGIGIVPMRDVHRRGAEIGYWLGEPFWGRGIATEALRAVTQHVLGAGQLVRLQACVYSWNPASARVLEKAGYLLEGTLRRAVIKFDQEGDVQIWARIT